jgi:hypothetical protein
MRRSCLRRCRWRGVRSGGLVSASPLGAGSQSARGSPLVKGSAWQLVAGVATEVCGGVQLRGSTVSDRGGRELRELTGYGISFAIRAS